MVTCREEQSVRPSLALSHLCLTAVHSQALLSRQGKGSRKHEPTLGELEGQLRGGQLHTKCSDEDLES